MATIYKVTKFTNLGASPDLPGHILLRCEMRNPGSPGSPSFSVDANVAVADIDDPAEIMARVDEALEPLGTDTVNWTL